MVYGLIFFSNNINSAAKRYKLHETRRNIELINEYLSRGWRIELHGVLLKTKGNTYLARDEFLAEKKIKIPSFLCQFILF